MEEHKWHVNLVRSVLWGGDLENRADGMITLRWILREKFGGTMWM